MCVPNLRSIDTYKLTKLENMQNRMFYLMSRDAKKRYVIRHSGWDTRL